MSLAEKGHIPVTAAPVLAKAASPVRDSGGQYRAEAKPQSIKQKIAAGKNRLAADRAAAPTRAAAKTKSNVLEV